MPYVEVADPFLNAGKSTRASDIKRMRDNQTFFNDQINSLILAAGISSQSISDDFMSVISSGAPASGIGPWWTAVTSGGSSTQDIISEHQLKLREPTQSVANHSGLQAHVTRQRIDKSEEYVAKMEVRIRRAGADDDHYFIGWQDSTLTLSATFNDVTDCVAVVRDSGGNWIARAANNAGGVSTVGPFGTATNWHIVRLEFTCSATAGSRKIEVYLDGSLQGTMSTDANIPSGSLTPTIGVTNDGAGASARDLRVDYAIFTIGGRAIAA